MQSLAQNQKWLTAFVWHRNFGIYSTETDCSRDCQMCLTVMDTCVSPEKGCSVSFDFCVLSCNFSIYLLIDI